MKCRFKYILYLMVFVLITACGSSMVRDHIVAKAGEVKIGGDFLLHDNPRKGDYAVYKVSRVETVGTKNPTIIKTESIERYEVLSVSKDQTVVSVKKRFTKADSYTERGRLLQYFPERDIYMKTGEDEEIYYLLPGGKIEKVILVNRDNGVTKEYEKAKPGLEGFMKYSDPEAASGISTAAGKFFVSKVTCRYPILTMKKFDDSKVRGYWLKKGQADIVTFVSPNVKFRKVRSEIKSEYDRLVDMVIANTNGTWFPKKATGHRLTETTEELIEQGTK